MELRSRPSPCSAAARGQPGARHAKGRVMEAGAQRARWARFTRCARGAPLALRARSRVARHQTARAFDRRRCARTATGGGRGRRARAAARGERSSSSRRRPRTRTRSPRAHAEGRAAGRGGADAIAQQRVGARAEAYAAYDVVLEAHRSRRARRSTRRWARSASGSSTTTSRRCPSSSRRDQKLVEEGGDWDRPQPVKVYESVFCIVQRDMKRAAELLLEGVATKTPCGSVHYERLIFYGRDQPAPLPRPLIKKN